MTNKLLRKSTLFFLLIGIFLGVFFAFLTDVPKTSAAAWYNSSWQYRKKITIDHTKVLSDLNDFPVLINLSSDADLAAKALANGDDILFTSSDGTTKFSHEIESYTTATGALAAWVKVSMLSSSANTEIYIYYGNAGAANQEDAENVWDSSYKMVQHFEETLLDGTAGEVVDSTANNNDGVGQPLFFTFYLGPTAGAIGQINSAFNFNDASPFEDYVDLGNDATLQITGEVTVEAWVKPDDSGQNDGLVGKLNSAAPNYSGFALVKDSSNYYRFVTGNGGTLDNNAVSNSAYADTNWHHIVGVRRGGVNYLYIDGVEQSGTGSAAVTDSGSFACAGRQYCNLDQDYFDGIIDEVRVSNTGRSADWIGTQYNNQSNPSDFHGTPGAEETEDIMPPAAVGDLTLSNPSTFSFDLDWTAPGDDDNVGTATEYDIRYSTSDINDGNWGSATQVVGEPTPLVAGSAQSMTVTGLTANTLYYFALKTTDDMGNISALSNVPSLTTLISNDTTTPAAITDLAVSNPTNSTLDLSWTATGDDGAIGTATLYDIRYSTALVNDANWDSATQVIDEPTPSPAGSSESMTITNLLENTTYFFAIKAIDDGSNASDLSNVPQGTTTGPPTGIIIPMPAAGAVKPTTVIFSGKAFPGANIELLRRDTINPNWRNARPEEYTISDDGSFYIKYIGLITGEYFFALRAEDKDNRKTSIISFNINFVSEDELIAENLFVPPTVNFEAAATKGSDLKISGYAGVNNKVIAEVDSVVKGESQADENGFYNILVNTSDLDLGNYYIRLKQIDTEGTESISSSPRAFKITALAYPRADFNNDNRVNVTDWSIFLFRWGSEDEELKDKIDLDGNGAIDIFDFSIFLMAMAS